MAKSIIQTDRERCYICGGYALYNDPLDEHHVFNGNPNRALSEKYGLKVYIHHNRCHIFGKQSVHQNADVDNALKAKVQQLAMEHYGWTVDDFRHIFGKSYI